MEELFSGFMPVIIIIFVVISIISSAAKKKAAQQRREQEGEAERPQPPQQPMRQNAISEIQRAFMMMTDAQDEPSQTSPQVSPPLQYDKHAEGFHSTHEGLHSSHHEGLHDKHEGQHSHEGTQKHATGNMSHEGTHGRTAMEAYQSVRDTAAQPITSNMYESVKIDRYFADEDDAETDLITSTGKRNKNVLWLFENQSDYAKAVIYSEILTRRSARR